MNQIKYIINQRWIGWSCIYLKIMNPIIPKKTRWYWNNTPVYSDKTRTRRIRLSGTADELLKPAFPITITLTEGKLNWLKSTLREINKTEVSKYCGVTVRNLLTQVIIELISAKSPVVTMPEWLCEIVVSLENEQIYDSRFVGIIEKSGISREHVSRSFRKYLGITPSQYMNVLRIRRAGQLIENSTDDMLEVCSESGFNNLGYFYKQFNNYFHMPPGEYRKNT